VVAAVVGCVRNLESAGDTPAATGTLEGNARSGFVKSVYSLKIDRIKVPDDF
jgi:hypothetical protein